MKISLERDPSPPIEHGHSDLYISFQNKNSEYFYFELSESHSPYVVDMNYFYIRFNEQGRIFCLMTESWKE